MSQTRCAIYARVSTSEQTHGYSLDTQLDACRAYAAEQDWLVVEEHVDPGASGTSDQRPGFQALIEGALGGSVEAIIVYSFDRLFRNMEHAVVYKNMLRRDGIQVVSVLEPVDPDSPFSFIYEGILDLFAAYYSVQLAAKIKSGLHKAVKRGEWPHRAPFGYVKIGGLVEVAEEGAMIAQAFKEFSSGLFTLDTWAERAYSVLGIRSPISCGRLSSKDWSRIFNSKFYAGTLTYAGLELPGNHKPLVDQVTWDKVQQVLLSNNGHKRPQRVRFYLLRGLVWSLDVDGRMHGAVATGKMGVEYRYYRSRKALPGGERHHVPVEVLEDQIPDILQSIEVDLDNLGLLAGKLDEALLLVLRVIPDVSVLYQHLDTDHQRQKFIRLVFERYGIKVSGNVIVSVVVKPPFRVRENFGGGGGSRTSTSLTYYTPFYCVPQSYFQPKQPYILLGVCL